jgi:hypothetical protein
MWPFYFYNSSAVVSDFLTNKAMDNIHPFPIRWRHCTNIERTEVNIIAFNLIFPISHF